MKTIKVWYCDFWPDFDFENVIARLVRDQFKLVLDKNNPDVVFYATEGNEHLKYVDKILVYYTGECCLPDFNICDYAIGFDYLTLGDRYLRYPLYKLYREDLNRLLSIDRSTNKKFCCFVVLNPYGVERNKMFKLLSQYKRVDSAGKFMNNMGGLVAKLRGDLKGKYEFQKNYKFCLCFENCVHDGYTTEKIIQAFAAGCIPIYLGNPLISKEFNPNSFVNCHDFPSLEAACEYIKKIDNDDELYNKIISNIKFDEKILDEAPLRDFLVHIFSQDLSKAKRAMRKCSYSFNSNLNIADISYRKFFKAKLKKLLRK